MTSARADKGWQAHTLPESLDAAVAQALEIFFSEPAIGKIFDDMTPDNREQLVSDMLSLRIRVDQDLAAFLAQADQESLSFKTMNNGGLP